MCSAAVVVFLNSKNSTEFWQHLCERFFVGVVQFMHTHTPVYELMRMEWMHTIQIPPSLKSKMRARKITHQRATNIQR